jgi:hypothetical protein
MSSLSFHLQILFEFCNFLEEIGITFSNTNMLCEGKLNSFVILTLNTNVDAFEDSRISIFTRTCAIKQLDLSSHNFQHLQYLLILLFECQVDQLQSPLMISFLIEPDVC